MAIPFQKSMRSLLSNVSRPVALGGLLAGRNSFARSHVGISSGDSYPDNLGFSKGGVLLLKGEDIICHLPRSH